MEGQSVHLELSVISWVYAFQECLLSGVPLYSQFPIIRPSQRYCTSAHVITYLLRMRNTTLERVGTYSYQRVAQNNSRTKCQDAQLQDQTLQALYCTLTKSSQKPCPVCDNQSTEPSHFEHFITCHTPVVSSELIVELLIWERADIFVHAKHFLHPVSLWPLSLACCYSFTLHLCIHHAILCINLWTFVYKSTF